MTPKCAGSGRGTPWALPSTLFFPNTALSHTERLETHLFIQVLLSKTICILHKRLVPRNVHTVCGSLEEDKTAERTCISLGSRNRNILVRNSSILCLRIYSGKEGHGSGWALVFGSTNSLRPQQGFCQRRKEGEKYIYI